MLSATGKGCWVGRVRLPSGLQVVAGRNSQGGTSRQKVRVLSERKDWYKCFFMRIKAISKHLFLEHLHSRSQVGTVRVAQVAERSERKDPQKHWTYDEFKFCRDFSKIFKYALSEGSEGIFCGLLKAANSCQSGTSSEVNSCHPGTSREAMWFYVLRVLLPNATSVVQWWAL